MKRRTAAGSGLAGWPGPAILVFVLLVAALAGCQQRSSQTAAPPGGGDAASSAGTQTQAERTRDMDEKARQLEEKAKDIQNMQGTEQEKADAVNKLEQERQDLNKTGGDGAAPAPPP